MKSRISQKSAKPSASWSRRFSRPVKPAVFRIGESIKHKFRVFQVYSFRKWYQRSTPYIFLRRSSSSVVENIFSSAKEQSDGNEAQQRCLTTHGSTECLCTAIPYRHRLQEHSFGPCLHVAVSCHIGLRICLHDTVFASYRIGLLFIRERFTVHYSCLTVNAICIHCAFCVGLQMNGRLLELIMRLRIQ